MKKENFFNEDLRIFIYNTLKKNPLYEVDLGSYGDNLYLYEPDSEEKTELAAAKTDKEFFKVGYKYINKKRIKEYLRVAEEIRKDLTEKIDDEKLVLNLDKAFADVRDFEIASKEWLSADEDKDVLNQLKATVFLYGLFTKSAD